MTSSRANSHGKNVYVLARRKERHSALDQRNEAVVAKALKAGRDRAQILHPTKGFRWVSLSKPRPFTGVRDWWARVIRKHTKEEDHG